jgi:aminoglycoside phosphotransferase
VSFDQPMPAPDVRGRDHAGNPGGMSGDALAAELPAPVAAFARDAAWDLLAIEPDGTTGWRLSRPGAPPVRLLVAPGRPAPAAPTDTGGAVRPGPSGAAASEPAAAGSRLAAEAARLGWLADGDVGAAGGRAGPRPGRPGPDEVVGGPSGPAASWSEPAAHRAGGGAPAATAERPGPGPGAPGAPVVLAVADDPASREHYLVTSLPAGSPALSPEHRGDADRFVVTLAEGLRRWHERPVAPGPFRVDLDERIAHAADRVAAGVVDRRRFASFHARYSAAELLGHLRTMRAALPERAEVAPSVLVHGRPTLAHTYLDGDAVSGYVGLDRAGVGDRYLDLAVMARELADHVSPHALGPFFVAYGLPAPDVHRLDVWLLLLDLL